MATQSPTPGTLGSKPPTTQSPPAEDAAGEGGDTIATFSNYVAPQWALQQCIFDPKVNNNDTTTSKSNTSVDLTSVKTKNVKKKEVILIDLSDDEDTIDHNDTFVKNNDNSTSSKNNPNASQNELTDKNHHHRNNSIKSIPSHSSPACESGLLASVSAPQPKQESLTIIRQLAQEGKLSPLQVEGAGLAIQRHCRIFNKISDVSNGGGNNVKSTHGAGAMKSKHVRAGFFLGDGAGIGKGRQIAAVLRDSLSRSYVQTIKQRSMNSSSSLLSSTKKRFYRRRHLWLSVSRELIEDARRDLEDIGCYAPVYDGVDELTNSKSSTQHSGILFITYAFLVSGKGKRLYDIIRWLSHNSTEDEFDGCIIFDEAHKAKNLYSDPPTSTGKLVLELQDRLPNARVMYCSATGVSDLKQLGYATRLGLWGYHTNYPTFESFFSTFEKKGVGAMEMLALEMKQAGCFVARTLSWDGAEFQSVKVQLSPQQIKVYNQSMDWWEKVRNEIKVIFSRSDMNGTPKMFWSQYWSAHQRFTKELAICAKVPFIVKDARMQLENGYSVVIGLQSTGEAGTHAAMEEIKSNLDETTLNQGVHDIDLPAIISTAGAIMAGFIRNHFPIAPQPVDPIKVPPIPPGGFTNEYDRLHHAQMTMLAERQLNLPPPTPKPDLLLKRQQFLAKISQIELPSCPLDDLIDKLGGVNNVAEMTGRSGRILKSKSSYKFVKRIGASKDNKYALSMAPSQEDSDRLNVVEKKKFMDGRKNVAIISDAASTGISLHAASYSKGKDRRRVHYTIELPWAADKAIQQLGRTHRSGQITAPVYKMVVSDLGGERRFAAAVAKRMASLGALTKGDRRAATGSDLSEFDVDSRFGRRSLTRLYDCMSAEPPYTPSKGSNEILDSYLVELNDHAIDMKVVLDRRLHALRTAKKSLEEIGIEINERKNSGVKTFLNRISALKVAEQNLVFSLFLSTMDDVLDEARTTGEFEGSVEQINATSIVLSFTPETITKDKSSGAPTKLMTFDIDRGCSFEELCKLCSEMIQIESTQVERKCSVARSGLYISKRQMRGKFLVMLAKRKTQLSFQDSENDNMIDHDPRGLMIITRPNTGRNPCEMTTADLRKKYNRLLSIDELRDLVPKNTVSLTIVSNILETHPKCSNFSTVWKDIFIATNNFQDQGLAPRRSKLSLVTGSVLHCLPALQKSVAYMSRIADRSLRIIRLEVTKTKSPLVGIKFPVNDEAIQNLKTIIEKLDKARTEDLNVEKFNAFSDEKISKVNARSVVWISTKPSTMKSFLKSAAVSISPPMKRKGDETHFRPKKFKEDSNKVNQTDKSRKTKAKAITAFFQKK